MSSSLIANLDISTRAKHLLLRMKLYTVDDFLNVPFETFSSQRGLGKKTIQELLELRERAAKGEIDESCEGENDVVTSETEQNSITFSEKVLEQLSKHSIKELYLSIRSFNGLMREGIATIDRLVMLSEEELFNLSNIGKKSVDEIIAARKKWLEDNYLIKSEDDSDFDISDDLLPFYNEIANAVVNIIPIDGNGIYRLCKKYDLCSQIEKREGDDLTKFDYLTLLEDVNEIRKALTNWFVDRVFQGADFVEGNSLIGAIEEEFQCVPLKEAIIETVLYGNILIKRGNYYAIARRRLKNHVQDLDDCDQSRMTKDRLRGKSLQEIGDLYGLTRERVRQVTIKTVSKFPLLQEDYYSSIFEEVHFSRDSFYSVFPKADEMTFEYLAMRYKKGNAELDNSFLEEYSGPFRQAIEAYINQNETTRWKKSLTRLGICRRVLISHSGEYFDKDSFLAAYEDFLIQNDLARDKYAISINTVNNAFRNSSYVVFDREGRFRYYEDDATKLWSEIDFSRYKDTVISAELIYRDYLDVMDEYNVRNGYELFCLLKNTSMNEESSDNDESTVAFRRIPVMIIGDGDEERQTVKLVKELAPIEYWKFYEAYEERYGIRKESASSNLGSFIEKYYVNGEYKVDLPKLTEAEQNNIKAAMCKKPIWTINELEEIFNNFCESSNLDALNVTTMYGLGYALCTGYAYSRDYSNVSECLEDYLFSSDLVDLNEINPDILRLSMIRSFIYQLKANLKYFEVSPKLLASRAFIEREYGITLDTVYRLQKKVLSICNEKYFNANSVWQSIESDEDVRLLNGNKWLCTSIMRQQDGVFSLVTAGAVILSQQKDELSLAKISQWICEREGKMTLEHLTNRINDLFGSRFDKYKIALKLNEQGNASQVLVDGVDAYLEQLISSDDIDDSDLFREDFF